MKTSLNRRQFLVSGALAAGALAQQRLLVNSPREVGTKEIEGLYLGAMKYW